MTNSRRTILILAPFAVGLLAWLAFGYFGIQALFTHTTVQDQIPTATTANPGIATITTSSSAPALAVPARDWRGPFSQGDSTYTISGTARIIPTNEGRVLVLEDFSVTNGPDLYVYLVQSTSTNTQAIKKAVREGNFVEIAPLKGNRGTQTYTLPASVELDESTVVNIWCKRFHRNFGSALLMPVMQ